MLWFCTLVLMIIIVLIPTVFLRICNVLGTVISSCISWFHCIESSVQFSLLVVSDSLQPHGLQRARPPCPSPTPGLYSNSCPLSQWCRPTILSSVVPFSFLQSFPASGKLSLGAFIKWILVFPWNSWYFWKNLIKGFFDKAMQLTPSTPSQNSCFPSFLSKQTCRGFLLGCLPWKVGD